MKSPIFVCEIHLSRSFCPGSQSDAQDSACSCQICQLEITECDRLAALPQIGVTACRDSLPLILHAARDLLLD